MSRPVRRMRSRRRRRRHYRHPGRFDVSRDSGPAISGRRSIEGARDRDA